MADEEKCVHCQVQGDAGYDLDLYALSLAGVDMVLLIWIWRARALMASEKLYDIPEFTAVHARTRPFGKNAGGPAGTGDGGNNKQLQYGLSAVL